MRAVRSDAVGVDMRLSKYCAWAVALMLVRFTLVLTYVAWTVLYSHSVEA